MISSKINKKILICTVPIVPVYFNAGHRLVLETVSEYLRNNGCNHVDKRDFSDLRTTWKDIILLLIAQKYDYVFVMNDFDMICGLNRLIEHVREFLSEAKICTFGRLSTYCPDFFNKYNLDYIVTEGDYELGTLKFIIKDMNIETIGNKKIFLASEELLLPNVENIDYSIGLNLYSNDNRKFCGFPNEKELVVPVARGCPINCYFCEIQKREGKTERRISVDRVIDYIESNYEKHNFEYVSMYAPTFTLDREWVVNFCNGLIEKRIQIKWKNTTTMECLDNELIRLMSKSGCKRISLGVESFENSALINLPNAKKDSWKKFNEVYSWCVEVGIELNCFVIIGLPGTSVDGIIKLFLELEKLQGVRIRPSFYCDYNMIKPTMSEEEVLNITSKNFLSCTKFSDEDKKQLYQKTYQTGL